MDFKAPALRVKIDDILAEYDAKNQAVEAEIEAMETAKRRLENAATVRGQFANTVMRNFSIPCAKSLRANLLESAWRHVYHMLQIDKIAPADDRKKFDLSMKHPPEFTLDNILATFGTYGQDTRFHILRGLAQCFADLDPAYRSHSRVKIGKKGLPKRMILTNCQDWGSWGYDRLRDTLNAVRVFEGREHIGHADLSRMLHIAKYGTPKAYNPNGRYSSGATAEHDGKIWFCERGVYQAGEFNPDHWQEYTDPEPGVEIRRFHNGNAHLIFSPEKLRSINLALAEFYGDVLPDAEDDVTEKRPGTAVSADLQFYPSPEAVIFRLLDRLHLPEGVKVLEPSCGDGRIMRAVLRRQPHAQVTGVEYHAGRAAAARAQGLAVMTANFLQCAPDPRFDVVTMNPPFSGRHYLKHIRHALKFLRPGGQLVAVLPGSAWYDHGDLAGMGGNWSDLPIASFAESGTNVPTGIFSVTTPRT